MAWNNPKLDAIIDGKVPDDLDSASVFSKVICHKISNGYGDDLYLLPKMNFVSDIVQTEATQFMNMVLPAINTLNESGVLGTPDTRIQWLTYGSYWSAPDNFLVN